MQVVSVLAKEHQLIKSFLEIISHVQFQLEQGKNPEKKIFERALKFSDECIDKYHHFKEEYLLFGLLAEKKHGELDHGLGALRNQHDRCKTYLKNIKQSLDGYERGNEISSTILLENLASYIALLKRHIYLEDHVYFKLADELLTGDENRELINQFSRMNAEPETPDQMERLKLQVEELKAEVEGYTT